jgi:hypothetical protein
MKIVRGEFFPKICNKVLYYYGNLYCNPNTINDGDSVYCDTHHILKYKDILNTKKDLTIVTHNSDHCLYDGQTDNPNGINVDELICYSRWFGQNSYSKKVIPIPIGFENTRWESSFGPKTQWLESSVNLSNDPKFLVYLNCNKNTNISERQKCYDEASKMVIVNIDHPNLTYLEYLNRIKEHMFVFSPRGNGLDCHRTWEVLMMRRVPILKREGQLEKLYKNIPVLFVDDWTDIHNMDLKKVFKSFSFDNQEYLEFEFWKNKI